MYKNVLKYEMYGYKTNTEVKRNPLILWPREWDVNKLSKYLTYIFTFKF